MNEDLTLEDTADGLRISGEIDAHTAPQLAKRLDPLPGETGDVVLDVSAVPFVDSSGLRAIIHAHQAAEHIGRRLVLLNPQRALIRLIDISGLTDYLHVEESTSTVG